MSSACETHSSSPQRFGCLIWVVFACLIIGGEETSSRSVSMQMWVALLGAFAISLVTADSDLCSNYIAKEKSKPSRDFHLRLFEKLIAAKPSENIVFSPLSIGLTLALLEEGAQGDTRTELDNFLYSNETQSNRRNWIHRFLKDNLDSRNDSTKNGYTLKMANGVFLGQDVVVKDEFLKKAECFDADVQGINFQDTKAAADKLNSWVSNATNGLITKMATSEQMQDGKVVLANAIYFQARWQDPFQEVDKTTDFYRFGKENDKQTVPDLRHLRHYEYYSEEDFHMVEIPYIGYKVALYIMLPKKRDGLQDIEKYLISEKLLSLKDRFSSQWIYLVIPQFTIRTPTILTDHLKNLGLNHLFSDQANLSGLSEQSLKASSVIHEAYIKVNVTGTEAAAATGEYNILVSTNQPIHFFVDHPFIFAIIHKETDAPLFIGKVNYIEQ